MYSRRRKVEKHKRCDDPTKKNALHEAEVKKYGIELIKFIDFPSYSLKKPTFITHILQFTERRNKVVVVVKASHNFTKNQSGWVEWKGGQTFERELHLMCLL